jgi:hypothetical protein
MTTGSDESDPVDRLHQLADQFAQDLAATLNGVLDRVPAITAELMSGRNPRLSVAPRDLEDPLRPNATIPLYIGGKHRLSLRVEMFCGWDSTVEYLTVDESKIALELAGSRAQPLFRFEYDRRVPDTVAAAHIQVHAHRDEIVYLMGLPTRARARQRAARGTMPILSELHIPVGGHRFRPCVEDVLEFAINEFGVETRDGWRAVLRKGRVDWRRKQVATVVRDSPNEAARSLAEMGWSVRPPVDRPHRERRDRMSAL